MHPKYKRIRQKTLFIGTSAVVIGMVGAFIPFLPGTIFTILGLSLLSLQSKLAFQILAWIRARYPLLTDPVRKLETKLIDFFSLTTHTREYLTIPSKSGQPIPILTEQTFLETGVAVILHSASGSSEGRVMETLAEECKKRGLTVVRFDAHNGLGVHEDPSVPISITATSMLEDLEQVLAWSKVQHWWQEPLVLVGHSIGGLVAALYASQHKREVQELVLFSPTVSGESFVQALKKTDPDSIQEWEEKGSRTIIHSLTKEEHLLSYDFVVDILRYNLFDICKDITIPTTLVGSKNDIVAPYEDTVKLSTELKEYATLLTMKNVSHTPKNHREMKVVRKTLQRLKLTSCITYKP